LLGQNLDLIQQVAILEQILRENHALFDTMEKARNLGLSDYYIGAGCIAQTVWNHQLGRPPMNGISDVDFAYWDGDLSEEAESFVISRVEASLSPGIPLDVKNEARVHLWYRRHFGVDIAPYSSLGDALNTWPTTATCVGVRLEGDKLMVYAPYGLNDLFGMIVRANKTQITEDIYREKTRKWVSRWPELTVIPW